MGMTQAEAMEMLSVDQLERMFPYVETFAT
jgi:hypothetical protein